MPSSYIYYTGIGAKPSGHHTTSEFVKIMKSITANNTANQELFKKYTLKQWMMYSGATRRRNPAPKK